ncbi:MAG: galactose-1-epimerase [Rubrobacteraceae bacterium]|nr:galactose-1-epimerase [Rubrobacteraceae bacterium]
MGRYPEEHNFSRRDFLKLGGAGLAGATLLGTASPSYAAASSGGSGITRQDWGSVDDQPVSLYTLTNGRQMTVEITNYGGIVRSIRVPDSAGRVENVALGFPKLADYVENSTHPADGGSGTTYFGATIGRYANRIANGKFTLNSQTYHLPKNNDPNTLHGGPNAFNTKVWDATTEEGQDSVALKLTYTDPGGYNGFPGTVKTEVTYELTQDNALRIDYRATTDKPTVINLTNHTYFNLAGEGSGDVHDQRLKINADSYTPTDETLIPTGEISPVAGTPFDFRTMKPIGRDIRNDDEQLVLAHGYDHNFVLNGSGMRLASVAEDPESGRVLLTYTDQPGVQFYTGNFLVGDLVGTGGRTYRQSDGFTLETQHFPDSPNQPSFPSTVLEPGGEFSSTTTYIFSTTGSSGLQTGQTPTSMPDTGGANLRPLLGIGGAALLAAGAALALRNRMKRKDS